MNPKTSLGNQNHLMSMNVTQDDGSDIILEVDSDVIVDTVNNKRIPAVQLTITQLTTNGDIKDSIFGKLNNATANALENYLRTRREFFERKDMLRTQSYNNNRNNEE